MRLIIVVRAAVVDDGNDAAHQADTDPAGGDRTFTVPLRQAGDATNTVRAYWCSWQIDPAAATALRTRLRGKGLTTAEVAVVTGAQKATFAPSPTAKAYIFDGDAWTPAEVLASLGLDVMPSSL